MDITAGAQLSLLPVVQSFLESKVIKLSLETGIFGVSIVVAQDMILERFRVKDHNLADAS